jgi:alpha-L-fucosidase
MRQTLLLILILITGVILPTFSQSDDQKSKPIGNERRIQEWKDARFGMMITWGPVTLKGTEISWSRADEIPVDVYDNLYKQFNPLNFNADEWVSVAKGTKIGSKVELKLPKTTAQKVRLVLKEFSKVPGIYEIVLL